MHKKVHIMIHPILPARDQIPSQEHKLSIGARIYGEEEVVR